MSRRNQYNPPSEERPDPSTQSDWVLRSGRSSVVGFSASSSSTAKCMFSKTHFENGAPPVLNLGQTRAACCSSFSPMLPRRRRRGSRRAVLSPGGKHAKTETVSRSEASFFSRRQDPKPPDGGSPGRIAENQNVTENVWGRTRGAGPSSQEDRPSRVSEVLLLSSAIGEHQRAILATGVLMAAGASRSIFVWGRDRDHQKPDIDAPSTRRRINVGLRIMDDSLAIFFLALAVILAGLYWRSRRRRDSGSSASSRRRIRSGDGRAAEHGCLVSLPVVTTGSETRHPCSPDSSSSSALPDESSSFARRRSSRPRPGGPRLGDLGEPSAPGEPTWCN